MLTVVLVAVQDVEDAVDVGDQDDDAGVSSVDQMSGHSQKRPNTKAPTAYIAPTFVRPSVTTASPTGNISGK